jgi:hypothetical protein
MCSTTTTLTTTPATTQTIGDEDNSNDASLVVTTLSRQHRTVQTQHRKGTGGRVSRVVALAFRRLEFTALKVSAVMRMSTKGAIYIFLHFFLLPKKTSHILKKNVLQFVVASHFRPSRQTKSRQKERSQGADRPEDDNV